jgi:hypothetical protein
MISARPGPHSGVMDEDYGRGETPAQRADRNLVELLQELRVLQTGVQIVFAFLLTMPFSNGFPRLNTFERDIYVGTLLLTMLSSAVLATPVALHRRLFHRGAKVEIVAMSTRITQLGLVFLALALTGAVLLVTQVVLGGAASIVITICTALLFGALWFVFPWRVRRVAATATPEPEPPDRERR